MSLSQTLEVIRPYLSSSQLRTLVQQCDGEEGAFFKQKLLEIRHVIETMPRTYGQDGLGEAAIVHLHYFVGGCDWWITELDVTDGVSQAFGLASMGYEPELGYISITELIENGAEMDLYWSDQTLGQVQSKQYA
jgi:hypothetical protein